MSGFDLFDAIDEPNGGPASGSSQPAGPGGPAGGGGPWDQSGGGGLWPGGQSGDGGGGGMWPGGGSHPAAGGWPGPAPGPASGGTGTPARSSNQSLSVPYKLTLRDGVRDGLLLSIKGVVKPDADKIAVDLCTGGDVAFHFNPRFNEGGRQVVVRNSCRNRQWGPEERDLRRFPFARGRAFEMQILCTSSGFQVSVDRDPLLTFRHRVRDLRSIQTLSIHQDLDLVSVDQRTQ